MLRNLKQAMRISAAGVVVAASFLTVIPPASAGPSYQGGGGDVTLVRSNNWNKNWNRNYNPNWNHRHYYNYNHYHDWANPFYYNWAGPFIGFGAGALFGAIITQPRYYPYAYRSTHVQRCLARYRTYNPTTDTYFARPGVPARCRL